MTLDQDALAFPIVDNIVITCPGNSAEVADFYAHLLRMQIIREDWLMIAKTADSEPRLAFDDETRPTLPDTRLANPQRPQQVHLDIPTSDPLAAASLATGFGAAMLEEGRDSIILRDPAGHPFCLYRDAEDERESHAEHPLSGRIGRVVFDCFRPRALAEFYARFLDMPERDLDTPQRVIIARTDRRLPALAFQRSQSPAPRWPDPAFPQQIHLDIWVDDDEPPRDLVLRSGATELPAMGGSCPVYADPAGHPFCICT